MGEVRPNYYHVGVDPAYIHDAGATIVEPVTVECQGVIEGLDLNFNLGSAMKYLWRSGRKEGEAREKDLSKAFTYLRFELERLAAEGND